MSGGRAGGGEPAESSGDAWALRWPSLPPSPQQAVLRGPGGAQPCPWASGTRSELSFVPCLAGRAPRLAEPTSASSPSACAGRQPCGWGPAEEPGKCVAQSGSRQLVGPFPSPPGSWEGVLATMPELLPERRTEDGGRPVTPSAPAPPVTNGPGIGGLQGSILYYLHPGEGVRGGDRSVPIQPSLQIRGGRSTGGPGGGERLRGDGGWGAGTRCPAPSRPWDLRSPLRAS